MNQERADYDDEPGRRRVPSLLIFAILLAIAVVAIPVQVILVFVVSFGLSEM